MSNLEDRGDIGITAVYTAQVARWGRLAGAELFDHPVGRLVFWLTNFFVGLGRLLRPGFASLRHTVLHRQVLIDGLVRQERPQAVLELACGLSRRGIALSADPEVRVVEVDLPAMVDLRRELLARSAAGRQVLARPNHAQRPADVATADLAALAPEAGPLVVTAEGLLMYLEAPAQRGLWRRVSTLLRARGGGLFLFDLVPAVEQPPPGRIGRALGWLMGRFTGGQGFARDERDRDALRRELLAEGFDQVELVEPGPAGRQVALPFPDRATQVLVFACRVRPGGMS